MFMKPRDLWALMVDIVSRCLQDTVFESSDQMVDDVLENCTSIDEESAALLRETVSGTLHFEKVCEGMLNGYCDCLRRNKSDKVSMYLVAYLMVFQYTALGGHRIREFLYRCTSTPRLVEYLEYILNPESLMQYSNPYWSQYYDGEFIMNSICRPMGEVALHVRQDVIHWLLGKTAAGVVNINETENPEQQQPRVSKRIPKKKVEGPLRAVEISKGKQGGLPPAEVREMLHTIPEKRPPRIDCTKPPCVVVKRQNDLTEPIGFSFMTRTPKKAPKVEEQPVCQSEFPRVSPDELRPILYKTVPVRMTAGALRREAQTYLKHMEEQKRSLEDVEAALRNSREFEEWQKQGREMEAQQRAAQFLSRKAQIQLAGENAVQKRKAIEEMKKVATEEIRADIASKIELCGAEEESRIMKQRTHASRLRRELEESRKKALKHAERERASVAAGVKKKSEQLKDEALEEEERLKMRRLLIIQEIRQLRERNRQQKEELIEKNICLQNVTPEDTTYGGLSLAMLREKLCQVKEENARLEEERRARIRALRMQEREKLEALSGLCSDGRHNTRRAKEEERRNKQEEHAKLEALREEAETKRAVQVRDSLKQRRKGRRAEQIALKEEDRRRRNEMLLLAKDTSAMEESHWQQQELCVINRLTVNQNEGVRRGFR
ncbi:putative trichohyalin-like [Trypanosoma grayi]|uniref:putative trichohyalin-like n=1 Tax=Trypanosoma grayi TaxID=71804 RepID=UPI0004F4388A|nr:putative trichohyalin-like [Trypanosoma grayi]KEG10579.1 putative trichohyalin-like [Trypanosoma grayi]